eukprot:2315032-Amphidinium_carterae.2
MQLDILLSNSARFHLATAIPHAPGVRFTVTNLDPSLQQAGYCKQPGCCLGAARGSAGTSLRMIALDDGADLVIAQLA